MLTIKEFNEKEYLKATNKEILKNRKKYSYINEINKKI
jgi:hypothetical protein